MSKKGEKQSPELIKKRAESLKGHLVSKETRRKIGNANRGRHHTEETKKRLSESHKGKIKTEEWNRKNSEAQKGEKNHNWRGGISKNPYPRQFNDSLKLRIRTRDNFTCCLCGKTEREELEELNRVLAVNHIDFNKNNCNENNLNTLCLRCNIKISREREYWTNYFQTSCF